MCHIGLYMPNGKPSANMYLEAKAISLHTNAVYSRIVLPTELGQLCPIVAAVPSTILRVLKEQPAIRIARECRAINVEFAFKFRIDNREESKCPLSLNLERLRQPELEKLIHDNAELHGALKATQAELKAVHDDLSAARASLEAERKTSAQIAERIARLRKVQEKIRIARKQPREGDKAAQLNPKKGRTDSADPASSANLPPSREELTQPDPAPPLGLRDGTSMEAREGEQPQ